MKAPRSLRLRLLAGAGVWVTLALLLSGIGLVIIFAGNIEQRARGELDATRNRVAAALTSAPDPANLEQLLPDPRYATPFGGLYWQVERRATQEVYRSRSLWDTTLSFPAGDESGSSQYRTVDGPDGQVLLALGSPIAVDLPTGPEGYFVIVAQDRAELDRATGRFGFEMAIDLAVLGIALFIAAWVQVNLGLTPLRKLASGIEGIRGGVNHRLSEDYPTEVLPLVREVNELLDARETSLSAARARAAELAHSLKTPMAVVAAVSERLQVSGDRENASTLASLSADVSAEIDFHLRRAGIRPRDSATIIRTSLNAAVLKTASVLRKTHAGETLHWRVELNDDAVVNIDEHDLLELIGVVLENGVKWASSQVRISAVFGNQFVDVTVEDDGPGLEDDQIARLGIRGERPRTDRPGSGLGLSIALEIVAVNSGTLRFRRSELGGLLVAIRLPTSTSQ